MLEENVISEKTSSLLADFMYLFGTSIETLCAGPVSGFLGEKLKNAFENKWAQFALSHTVPTYAAGAVFAIAGTLLKYAVKYEAQKNDSPDQTFSDFLKEYKGQMALDVLKIWAVGGTAFSIFTACAELSGDLFKSLEILTWIVPSAIGMSNFIGNDLLSMGCDKKGQPIIPFDKLPAILGVFLGFTAGGKLVDKVSNEALKFMMPSFGGAAGAFIAQSFWSAAKKVKDAIAECCTHEPQNNYTSINR